MTPLALCVSIAVGSVVDLSGAWRFEQGDESSFSVREIEDFDWQRKRLPTALVDWSDRWAGYGWYRKHFALDEAPDVDWLWSVGFARESVEVFVNGVLIGRRGSFGTRPKGGAPAELLKIPVSRELLREGDNVLAMRIFDPSNAGGITKGPMLIGPAPMVTYAVGDADRFAIELRLVLGLFTLALALLQFWLRPARADRDLHGWLLIMGGALSVYFLAQTGLLRAYIPALALASRVDRLMVPLMLLAAARYLFARFGMPSRWLRLGEAALVLWFGVLLLAPEHWVYPFFIEITVVATVAVSLVGAHVVGHAVRRRESGAFLVFLALVTLLALGVYDGFDYNVYEVVPTMSSFGIFALLVSSTFATSSAFNREYRKVLTQMLDYRRRLEGQRWSSVLEATALSAVDRVGFLDVIVNEAARTLDVRRCSLALSDEHGDLTIIAAVGLPTKARGSTVNLERSITGWVFQRGETLTEQNVPDELAPNNQRHYVTQSFVSVPVYREGTVVGVLSASDRLDGSAFSEGQVAQVVDVAEKLGVVLERMASERVA